MYGRKDGEWDVVADADDVYTKTETNTLLDDKADKATTYTKTEVDNSQDAQDNALLIIPLQYKLTLMLLLTYQLLLIHILKLK